MKAENGLEFQYIAKVRVLLSTVWQKKIAALKSLSSTDCGWDIFLLQHSPNEQLLHVKHKLEI